MRGMKVVAIAVGAVVVFFVVDSLVHVVLGLLMALAFVAIVAGGVYVAAKIVGSGKKHVNGRSEDHQVRDEPHVPVVTSLPAPPAAAHTANVDDELARLKREMGS